MQVMSIRDWIGLGATAFVIVISAFEAGRASAEPASSHQLTTVVLCAILFVCDGYVFLAMARRWQRLVKDYYR